MNHFAVLTRYELKKLFGVKYLWVFLFVLLMLNTAIAWYTADHSYAAEEPTQMISEFFEEYFENPEELDAYHAEMQAFAAEQEELFREEREQTKEQELNLEDAPEESEPRRRRKEKKEKKKAGL